MKTKKPITQGIFKAPEPKSRTLEEFVDAMPNARNAHTVLREWFAELRNACERISADEAAHAPDRKLAKALLGDLEFATVQMERIDTDCDRHFAILECMRVAQRVRDLEFSLKLLPAIDAQRRIGAGRVTATARAAAVRRNIVTRPQYDQAKLDATSNGRVSRKKLAQILQVTGPTLRRIETELTI